MSESPAGSRSERTAEALRARILAGCLPPGSHLEELSLTEELAVSRNTLREAFRLLAHDGLAVHEPNRGVFVRHIGAAEGRELYAARRALECAALREVALREPDLWRPCLTRMETAVREAQKCSAEGDWVRVGSANAEFHMALVALAGNAVIDSMMRTLTTGTRLLFLGLGDASAVHASFVEENHRLAELVHEGYLARAAVELEIYLLKAENRLLGGAQQESVTRS